MLRGGWLKFARRCPQRTLFIYEKDRRRLAVGSHPTMLFENGRNGLVPDSGDD
jgi:hypothetical protein